MQSFVGATSLYKSNVLKTFVVRPIYHADNIMHNIGEEEATAQFSARNARFSSDGAEYETTFVRETKSLVEIYEILHLCFSAPGIENSRLSLL